MAWWNNSLYAVQAAYVYDARNGSNCVMMASDGEYTWWHVPNVFVKGSLLLFSACILHFIFIIFRLFLIFLVSLFYSFSPGGLIVFTSQIQFFLTFYNVFLNISKFTNLEDL